MHTLIAVGSQAQSIPFWLQMTSIILAPILGFTGVAIGVILTERHRRIAYVTSERRKAYQGYLTIATQVNWFYSNEIDHARDPLSSGLKGDHIEMQSLVTQLYNCYLLIKLIGSPDAIKAANAILSNVETASIAILGTADGKPIGDNLANFLGSSTRLQTKFAKVARKDLGLSPREWEIPQG